MGPLGFLGDLKQKISDTLSQFRPTSNFSYGYQPSAKPAPIAAPKKAQSQQVAPQPQQQQQVIPQPQQNLTQQMQAPQLPQLRGHNGAAPINGQDLYNLLSKARGPDLPILQHLALLINAGNQLPQNIDPLLPIILAIRETQGGKYNKGQNNPYNIRGEQLGQTSKFIDYPSLDVATMGGYNPMGNVNSQGLTGLIGQNNIYSDFRNSGKLQDLFAHYSPPSDSNGSLDQQAGNYDWIRNNILGIPQ